jgi:SAM-dependent methyltransferase
MSGFSSHWLGLREPVDHASRNKSVQATMLECLRKRHGPSLVGLRLIDLGCGSGSNVRALAPLLGDKQDWTLVDYDQALLDVSRELTVQWADVVIADQADYLEIQKAGKTIRIRWLKADLNQDIESVLANHPHDMVSAAALFDLISPIWMERFCRILKVPFYTVLTYDGRCVWSPSHEDDDAVLAAFHLHQTTDKGFGAAAGPQAAEILARCLQSEQFEVVRGDSAWRLDGGNRALLDLLHQGMVQAVAQTGRVNDRQLDQWLAVRLRTTSCLIGHEDTLAVPPQ